MSSSYTSQHVQLVEYASVAYVAFLGVGRQSDDYLPRQQNQIQQQLVAEDGYKHHDCSWDRCSTLDKDRSRNIRCSDISYH